MLLSLDCLYASASPRLGFLHFTNLLHALSFFSSSLVWNTVLNFLIAFLLSMNHKEAISLSSFFLLVYLIYFYIFVFFLHWTLLYLFQFFVACPTFLLCGMFPSLFFLPHSNRSCTFYFRYLNLQKFVAVCLLFCSRSLIQSSVLFSGVIQYFFLIIAFFWSLLLAFWYFFSAVVILIFFFRRYIYLYFKHTWFRARLLLCVGVSYVLVVCSMYIF